MIGRLIKIGFWKDTREFSFERLPDPRQLVDLSWPKEERELVAVYLDAAPDVEHWMGFSYCRFNCGAIGTQMGTTDKSDGTYLWPEGLSHYVRVHSVRLPEEFVQHVLRKIGSGR